ncbi:uncharacterized protein LOC120073512 [Benincasa hispida]|uniref:uncharacterized protein LOC120073512 n=1 Tax=Benincasa hispida TaxID=102211 RepID=UPI0019016DBA|nr:uncharacterized protein LOC120073512 [Benincasa hispida]
MDYRKLNVATKKYHFPLPFIDQMLERLAGNDFYCFLDGYFGCNQIIIALEDQDKTTFTCPYGTFAFRRIPFGLYNVPSTFQRFEMKSVMLQMLQTVGQFGGSCGEDPNAHMKRFLETCNSFMISGITPEAIRLFLFPYSLRDDAKQWVSSLERGEITTWEKLVEKFMQKYFPPTTNARRHREIMNFE